MKLVHYIEMRVFSKEEDDEQKIIAKIEDLFPFDFKKEKIRFKVKTAYGFEDKKIKIFTLSVNKSRYTSLVLKNIISHLTQEQKDMLFKQIDSRLDDSLHFYLRLDKTKFLNNEWWITDLGNCYHLKFAIAAYPHKRKRAKEIIGMILKNDFRS